MNQIRRRSLVWFAMWGDIALGLGTLLLIVSYPIASFWNDDIVVVQHPLRELLLLVGLLWVWHVSFALAGIYKSFRLADISDLVLAMLRGTACAGLFTALWLTAVRFSNAGALSARLVAVQTLVWMLFNASILFITRIIGLYCARTLRRYGRNLRYVLIVGSNQRALRVAEMLTDDPGLGYRLIGFVDDSWHAPVVPEHLRSMLTGGFDGLPDLLRTLALDEVIISLPIASQYTLIRHICHLCSEQGILVRCEASLIDFADNLSRRSPNHLQFVTLNQHSWNNWTLHLKRIVDVVVAAAALVLTLPLFLCIALAIKFTSPGPVFFLQERLGLGKRIFKIYKFRTMVVNAEALLSAVEHLNQSKGPTFKLSQDPRITPLGAFLRKTSLDEIPQFINVLLGHMSLVGPRPLPLRDYRGFSEDWHRRRFSVKPGITCLWQVMGRSSIGFERWMELDMHYIDSWSMWLDLKILLQTISVVVRGSGAV